MKRKINLFEKIVGAQNIKEAFLNALKRKRKSTAAILFCQNVDKNLKLVQKNLLSDAPHFGDYKQFKIYEPKERIITAAPFAQRVMHHAIINVLESVFERQMIFHTYACRKGKGTHRAIKYAGQNAKKFPYFLKLDVRKYFDSIDHDILKNKLRRIIKDARTLKLLYAIIDSYCVKQPVMSTASRVTSSAVERSATKSEQISPLVTLGRNDNAIVTSSGRGNDILSVTSSVVERSTENMSLRGARSATWQSTSKGLPIGNLTSQFFANLYLSSLDHFILEQLKPCAYARYMDDMVLWADTKSCLKTFRTEIEMFCKDRLLLCLKEAVIGDCKSGVSFLGYLVSERGTTLLQKKWQLKKKKMRRIEWLWECGQMSEAEAALRLNAIMAGAWL